MPQFFVLHGEHAKETHAHHYYQIIWFRRGSGTHTVDFKEYAVTDNTIFFIAPGRVHSFDDTQTSEGIIVQFNAEFLATEESDESVFLKYNIFNAYDSAPCFTINEAEAERCQILVDALRSEYDITDGFAHGDYLRHLIHLFLIRIQRTGQRDESRQLNVRNQQHLSYVRFRDLVERNFRKCHIVSEYADMMNISVRTLTKHVNQCSPYTPLRIINDRIVLEAKRELRHTALTVQQIAYGLGFDDPSYFVRFFKRQTGMSTTEVREGGSKR